ncbi:MAG TPA: LysR family transcriptional regulator [Nakamurella sp.]|jgi:DNA-binding transcriptional LysR family regulator
MVQIDLRQLEYFVAVAEELNFTRAARRCHVVQSALSYQIAKLERGSGVVLFERTSRSVALAPGGWVLLPRARRILAELDLATAELTALAGVLTGRLRLGMIGSAAAEPVVERALVTFHRRHPGVEIAIEDTGSADMAGRIRGGDLDLALVGLFADQLPPDLAHRVLAVEALVAVLPPGHPLASSPEPVGLATLAGEEFVEMRAESGLRHQVDAAFARAGIARSIAFELSTSDAVVRFVRLGLGVALVPRSAAEGRDVAVRSLADPLAVHPVSLVHRAPAPSAPSARAFLALLADRGVDG